MESFVCVNLSLECASDKRKDEEENHDAKDRRNSDHKVFDVGSHNVDCTSRNGSLYSWTNAREALLLEANGTIDVAERVIPR